MVERWKVRGWGKGAEPRDGDIRAGVPTRVNRLVRARGFMGQGGLHVHSVLSSFLNAPSFSSPSFNCPPIPSSLIQLFSCLIYLLSFPFLSFHFLSFPFLSSFLLSSPLLPASSSLLPPPSCSLWRAASYMPRLGHGWQMAGRRGPRL